MVEHLAVNQRVAGSSPAPGAKEIELGRMSSSISFACVPELNPGNAAALADASCRFGHPMPRAGACTEHGIEMCFARPQEPSL
jgi:hypothetical protein